MKPRLCGKCGIDATGFRLYMTGYGVVCYSCFMEGPKPKIKEDKSQQKLAQFSEVVPA